MTPVGAWRTLGAMAEVLIVKTGSAVPSVVARRGDFEDWIAAGLALPSQRVRVVRIDTGEPLPNARRLAGIVVTGSSAMVSERLPWSEAAAAWMAAAVRAGTPTLGICYGHQLLAQGLGGRVAQNPQGREIGTVAVTLTAEAVADPLLGKLAPPLSVHATHQEAVLELPSEAILLASTQLDTNHAFRVGRRAWGVQFHPEFDADILRGYLEARRDVIEAEGTDVDALLAGVLESSVGSTVLRRFGSMLDA